MSLERAGSGRPLPVWYGPLPGSLVRELPDLLMCLPARTTSLGRSA